MTLLLTGWDGFVGTHFRRAADCVPLATADGTVIDLRDRAALGAAIARIAPSAVVHLAAQSFVPESFRAPRDTFDINFGGTLNLLEALAGSGFSGRFLFVGSGDVYGLVPPEALPVAEHFPLRPRSPYAVSKVAAEALCYQWSQTGPFEVVMTRAFNHVGPGQNERFALSDFARQLARIARGLQPPRLAVGDLDVTRDFTDVRDVVAAYRAVLARGRNGEVYNVCSGQERSVREMLAMLVKISGADVDIEPQDQRVRPAEQRRACGSPRKLSEHTGWEASIPIERTLRDLFDHWKEQTEP